MAQVDSENSTVMPRFDAAALPFKRCWLGRRWHSASTGDLSAIASSDVDPIIALIEEYRTAAKTVAAAVSEHSRRNVRNTSAELVLPLESADLEPRESCALRLGTSERGAVGVT
jgi:hypothetical protein